MATNPYFTQLHTQRFSLIGSPQQRDGTYQKDQRFVNMYPELIKSPISDGKKYYLKKRPGVELGLFQVPPGAAQGLYYWEGTYFFAVGGVLYANGVGIINLAQSIAPVGFCEFRDDTPSDTNLIICDGIKGWLVDTTLGVQQITDPNFPSPHIPSPIFMDGYIFVAAANTQTIHNSALQAPLSWPSDGFIDAEMYPDDIVMLSKQQNYIVAVGTQSIEFLYDNANATGSPLQRNAPAVSQFGCPAPRTVQQTEKELILVGTTNAGGRTVWLIDGFQPTEIANEPVREALDLEGQGIAAAIAMTVQCAGHKWYILNLVVNGRTFVYDFDEQMWHEWTSGVGQQCFDFAYAADSVAGTPAFLSFNTGFLGYMSELSYQDLNGTPIRCMVQTVKIDFDTIMRKRFFRLSMIGDAPATGDTPMTINWSDDDYNTWVGNRTLQLNGSYPTITQMGSARRRAFQFIYQQNLPLRLEAFELDVTQEVRR